MCDTSRTMAFDLPRRRPALRFTGNLRSLGSEALDSGDFILEEEAEDDDAETRVGKTLEAEPKKVELKPELGQPRKRTPLPSPAPKLPTPAPSMLAAPPSRRTVSPTRATVPAPAPSRSPVAAAPPIIEIPPPPLRGTHQERVVIIPTPNSTRRRELARNVPDPEPSPWIGDETRNAPMRGVIGRQHSMSDAETLMIEREAIERERARLAADARAAKAARPFASARPQPVETTVLKRPPPPPATGGASYAAWILVAVIMGVVSFHVTPNAYAKIQAQRTQRQ